VAQGPSISGSGAGDRHIFRKTVAILISERVNAADTASQQLGHSSPAITSGERWVALDPRTLAALKEYVTTWSMERDLLGGGQATALRLARR
jgi:integrase